MRRTLLVLPPIAQPINVIFKAAHSALWRVPKWVRFGFTVLVLLAVELAPGVCAAICNTSSCRGVSCPPPNPNMGPCDWYFCDGEGIWNPEPIPANQHYSCPTDDSCYINGVCDGNSWCIGTVHCAPNQPGPITGAPGTPSLNGGVVNQYGPATFYQLYKNGTILIYNGPNLSSLVTEQTDGQYSYKVQGCNSFNCGAFTPEVTVTVNLPPGPPGAIGGPTYRGPDYTISWGVATGTVQNYKLQESGPSGNLTYNNGTSTSMLFSGRPYGTYYYQVEACNNGTNVVPGRAARPLSCPPV
jgi:hypothetical protein